MGVAEQGDIRAALPGTLGQAFAAHLDAVMVAMGVEEQHPTERNHSLAGFVVVHITVARHAVDGVGDWLFAQLQRGVQIVQTVAEVEHSVGGLVIQKPTKVAQAAMDVGDD